MTPTIDPEKASQVIEEIKSEITKPGSILCLAKCVEIIKMLTDDVNPINLDKLTEAILQDTFLTTKVLQYANSAQYNRSGKRISTVSQCILILGLAVIRSIVLSVLLLEEYPNETRAEGIRNRGMISAFGGSMARTIAKKINYQSPEHAFIAAAFCQFGKLLIYSYLPEKSAHLEKLIQENGKSEEDAAIEVFGMRLESLGKRIGEYLTLPMSITCYMDPFEILEEEKKEVNSSVLGIANASYDVCKIVEHSKNQQELEEKLNQCAALRRTGINPQEIVATFRDCLDDVSQYYPVTSTGAAATFWDKLDNLSGQVRAREAMIQKARTKGGITPGDGPNIYVFTDGVATVSSLLGAGTVRSVLAAIAETIFLGFSARNVMLGVRRHSNNEISSVVAFGVHSPLLEKVKIPMGMPTHELHYAVLHSGKTIFISKNDVAKFSGSTPIWIKSITPASFLLIPITHDGVRHGLIYVDGSNLSPEPELFTKILAEIDKLKYYAGLKLHSQQLEWD